MLAAERSRDTSDPAEPDAQSCRPFVSTRSRNFVSLVTSMPSDRRPVTRPCADELHRRRCRCCAGLRHLQHEPGGADLERERGQKLHRPAPVRENVASAAPFPGHQAFQPIARAEEKAKKVIALAAPR